MKNAIKILGIVLLFVVVLAAAAAGLFGYANWKMTKLRAEDQANMTRPDGKRLGERLLVPRDGKDPVEVNLYIPEGAVALPVVFNIHGGAFIAGDDDTLDTQSDRISKSWNVIVVNINYRLMTDETPIAYGTEEVADVIRYCKAHAEEYHADPGRLCVMGYSAGAYHAAAAVLALKAEDIDVAAQVLCHAYIGDAVKRYHALTPAQQGTIAPALFALADNDSFSEKSLTYQAALEENGISADVRRYAGSIHGFIEENNPEYEKLHITASRAPEQERMARDAELLIGNWAPEQMRRSS